MGVYASAILMCLAAVLLGHAVCVLSGYRGATWLAAPVGFAALMIICQVAIKLPGRAWTAVAAVIVLSALSVWIAVRRRAAWPDPRDGVPVFLIAMLYLSVPFLANARIGLLGVSLLNDTRQHMLLAESLRNPAVQQAIGPGYPLGPHAIAATFAQMLGADVDKTLTGLLMATPLLTGLGALAALGDVSRTRRWLVAVLAAIPYLGAAWYIQSAFKEPILALFLLGMVVTLQAGRREAFRRPVAIAVPIAVLTVGILYDFSYPGLVWPVAMVVCWLAFELVFGGAWRHRAAIARGVRAAVIPVAIGLLILVVLVLPDVGQLRAFWLSNGGSSVGTTGGISVSSLADLAGPLRALEGLNIWLSGDFRILPPDQLTTGLLAGLALIALVYAGVSAVERRDLVWPGAVLGLGLVYLWTKHTQSPYVAAKALMVPAPLLAVGIGGALMRRLNAPDWSSLTTLAIAGGTIVFFVFSLQSSYLVLANGFVDPENHINELRSLRRYLHHRPTLVLFYDDYYQWELLGVPASSPVVSGTAWSKEVPLNPLKPWAFGQALDFDSVTASTLNEFDYVITTRAAAQSEPPPNFHPIATSPSYEVWQRVGPTPPHLVLPESGAAGAILNCATPDGRRISHEQGLAMVRGTPRYFPVAPLAPGGVEPLPIKLPPGEWDLSLPFTSSQAVIVNGPGLNVRLAPNLDRVGEIWPVGRVHSTGSTTLLTFEMTNPGLIRSTSEYFVPTSLIATPVQPERSVPLRAACGQYVDWYTLK